MSLRVLKYIALECERQESGEVSVYNMAYAWNDVSQWKKWEIELTVSDIRFLFGVVEPEKTKIGGFRKTPVTFADGTVIPWERIERQMHNLMSHHRGITPEEFYQEFESIHPGIDGNGRVGCILYNFLRGSMNIPIKPPEFRKV